MRKCLKICFIKFSEKSYQTESQTRDDKRSVTGKNGKKLLLTCVNCIIKVVNEEGLISKR